jgi:hypothetical protein
MAYGKIKMGKGPKKPDKSDAFVLKEKRKKPKPGFGINPPKPGKPGTPRVPKPGLPKRPTRKTIQPVNPYKRGM